MSFGSLTGRATPSARLWTGAVPTMTGSAESTSTGVTRPVAFSSM